LFRFAEQLLAMLVLQELRLLGLKLAERLDLCLLRLLLSLCIGTLFLL
jgi:hypothetical protein